MTYKILLFVFCLITFIACNETQEKELDTHKEMPPPPEAKKEEPRKKPAPVREDEYTEEKVDLGLSKEDENLLLLNEKFPIGTNFKKIHDEFGIKGVRPEGGSDELAAQGLTESKTQTSFLNKPVEIEFNFKNDSLYSFYYTIIEPDFNNAEKLHKGLQQFYNKKFGKGIEPSAEEDTRHIRTTFWTDKVPYGIMTYNVNTGQISWGFQNTKP